MPLGANWGREQLKTALARTYGPQPGGWGWVTRATPVLMGHGVKVRAGAYVSNFVHWGFDTRTPWFMTKNGKQRVTPKFPKRSAYRGVDRSGKPLTAAQLRQRREAARSRARKARAGGSRRKRR